MFGLHVRKVGLALAVLLALALAAAPALASETGQQVQHPGTGAGNWQPLGSQPLEFALAYDGIDAGAEIVAASFPASRAGFNVYTDWEWKQLAEGNPGATPIGKGTRNPHEDGNLTWRVATGPGELYHIQVYLIGTEPAAFWIDLRGAGGSVLSAISPLPEPPQAQPAPQAQATPAGSGAEAAGAPQPPAQPGQYDFQYSGGNLPVEVEVAADPGDSVGFNVYTDEQWQHLAANPAIEPIGRGTRNAHAANHLTWAMKTGPAGLYHVQVYQTGPRPGEYSIVVRGQGVNGPPALTPAQ